MTPALAVLAGYLLGSIPFGLLVAKLARTRDIRRAGSGNIGAANVARVAGVWAGLATLLLDAGKGAAAVWLAGLLTPSQTDWQVAAGIAAVLGHLFPVWLKFRGGRGVATAAGAFVLISPIAVGGAVVVWIIVMLIWRYASLSSIFAAAALPLLMYWLYAPGYHPPQAVSLGAIIASLLIIWRHRPNLQRLMAGTEPRFGRKR
jgi:acyl phosphate:glycerol-3-phosphate acyltransferase